MWIIYIAFVLGKLAFFNLLPCKLPWARAKTKVRVAASKPMILGLKFHNYNLQFLVDESRQHKRILVFSFTPTRKYLIM